MNHFKNAILNRYGVKCTKILYDIMIDQIISCHAILVQQINEYREIYIVKLDRYGEIIVVYQKGSMDGYLVTALPSDYRFVVHGINNNKPFRIKLK